MSKSIFNQKKVFILSPQTWDFNLLSKHHYAFELAKLGAEVFFIYSIGGKNTSKLVSSERVSENINYITFFRLFFSSNSRLKRALNKILEFIQINLLILFLGRPDVVWTFDQNRFINVNYFRAKKIIFHPVDYIKSANQSKMIIAQKSNCIFSVSDEILSDYKNLDVTQSVINHGLSENFLNIVDSTCPDFIEKTKINIGYVGTISNKHVDWVILFKIIDNHPNSNFVFIGYYVFDSNIEKLQQRKNVKLTGKISISILPSYMRYFDMFLTTYKTINNKILTSNSHKILEYLSTGKIIISNFFSYYEKHHDLLLMSKDNNELPTLFNDVIENLDKYNAVALSNKRKTFAKDNTYKKQLKRIETIINTL